jgi:hypothetical protein
MAESEISKPRWIVEKKISFGDLATIILIFASGFAYVTRNETDKTRLAEQQVAADKRFEEYKVRQIVIDAGQDGQVKDGIARIEQKLESLNGYLLRNKKE